MEEPKSNCFIYKSLISPNLPTITLQPSKWTLFSMDQTITSARKVPIKITILDYPLFFQDLNQIKLMLDKSNPQEMKQFFRGILPHFIKFMDSMIGTPLENQTFKIRLFLFEFYSKVFLDPDFADINIEILKRYNIFYNCTQSRKLNHKRP